ncbi:hypothetical protein GQX73_g6988 [Xylaria multiplex]|uniref:Uncharacterized protein n=1 Tax=Xylaria multiplex TaxID=323545 RepID=A0A7C8IP59_9PEZI|nr:hypothetical protein GQX73_g6988 [Xylaria multiplex]
MAQGTTLEQLDNFKPSQIWEHGTKPQDMIRTQPWKAVWPPSTETPPKEEKPHYPATHKLPGLQAAFGYNDVMEAHSKSDFVAEPKE